MTVQEMHIFMAPPPPQMGRDVRDTKYTGCM